MNRFENYDFNAIEAKWQKYWADNATFRQPNPGDDDFVDAPKTYVLDMFPYPSGAGLHVGHPEGYTATDIFSRFRRMKGYNVLHPMGYDSFGLPAEQYAVEHGVHPRETTEKNIANIERQIKMFGFSYDWSRRVATTDTDYYRWTQWIFLQLYNSWYDQEAGKSKPIGELIDKLIAGTLALDIAGNVIIPSPASDLSAYLGKPVGIANFNELPRKRQREIIDSNRLAYMAEVPVNWCPRLGTVLANEEVTNDGKSERGDHPVYRRALKQWMLRITAYADRLGDDLEHVDWPEPVKIMQRNWIGKSKGAEVDFPLELSGDEQWFDERACGGFPASCADDAIRVYTTRPDTLFGATYMVLAPEHPLVEMITTDDYLDEVNRYIAEAGNKSEMDRTAETKDKTGVFTGAMALNPINCELIPVWVADYVMMGYGTGAIMAVPAHDTRDMAFAEKYNLDILQVVEPPDGEEWRGFVGDGKAVNSGDYTGLTTAEFKTKIISTLEADGLGKGAIKYKLRDWLFARQRYWGEPIPIVHCDNCGPVSLTEEQLPLLLPAMEDFSPASSDDPNAMPSPPLGKMTSWVNTTCPLCQKPAQRELNTMPQWAGSCWYFLRYLDPKNESSFCDSAIQDYWMGENGVDLYVGGAEHAVLHLLYARFWHKVLYDLGAVTTIEPFGKLYNQGMIRSFAYRDKRGVYLSYDEVDTSGDKPICIKTGELAVESVEKMSKSLKNVVNPDDVISQYGADTFRLYEMFMGPLDATKPWSTRDVPGVHRFLNRVWRMIAGVENNPALLGDTKNQDLEKSLHKLIKKVGADIEAMKFNTAIAAMMDFVNQTYKAGSITPDQAKRFILVLAPFAPHIAEELWNVLGEDKSLSHHPFPSYDDAVTADDTVELPVQINGKIKAKITVSTAADNAAIALLAKTDENIAPLIEGKTIVKEIVVPGRMVNLVVK